MPPKITKLAIDGDILAFKAACAIETRTVVCTHMDSGRQKEFANRTEFYGRNKKKDGGWLAELNAERETKSLPLFTAENFIYEDKQTHEPVHHAYHIVNTLIEGICNACGCDEFVISIGEEDNFREQVATIRKYKDRDHLIRPLCLDEVKDFIKNKYKAVTPVGYETDDLLSIWVTQNPSWCQVTTDKDARQVPGWWIDPDKMEKPFYIPNNVGKVWKDEKGKIRAYGFKSLMLQQLCGDSVDTILPRALCDAKFGEVGAMQLLEPRKTHKECLQAVVEKYKEWYPEEFTYNHWNTGEEITADWLAIASEIFLLLYMKRQENDPTTFKSILDLYKVKY
jgi:hypothetical protein